MTPRQLWRNGGPVEAQQLTRHNLAGVKGWLAEQGYAIEIHEDDGDHGLISHDDGLVRVRVGDWISLTDGSTPQVWDERAFWAEHGEAKHD